MNKLILPGPFSELRDIEIGGEPEPATIKDFVAQTLRKPITVVVGFPPNIDKVDAVFKVRDNLAVIYAYDRTIYAPGGEKGVTEALMMHETVHCDRQMGNPEPWWDRYMADPQFRLIEEIPAHYAEYCHLAALCTNRQDRRRELAHVAKRLSGPLYGNLISLDVAKQILEKGPQKAMEMQRRGIKV